MKILFVFPFLALFGVPLAWETNAWHSHPFASETKTENKIRDDSIASTAAVSARPLMHERTRLPHTASRDTPQDTSSRMPAAQRTAAHERSAVLEESVFQLLNEARAADGAPPLERDAALDVIARAHSADMGLNGYIAHADHTGCTVSCRAERAGYRWRAIAENIYAANGGAHTAENAVASWSRSTGHRLNLSNPIYTRVGIGAWHDGAQIYLTTVFADQP